MLRQQSLVYTSQPLNSPAHTTVLFTVWNYGLDCQALSRTMLRRWHRQMRWLSSLQLPWRLAHPPGGSFATWTPSSAL